MQTQDTPERLAFYAKIDKSHLTPLWKNLSALITPEPKSAAIPYKWDFDVIRAAMLEAGGLITAKEAERRVLVLENPGLRGQSKITTSLYCGVQLVIPNEVAPAHRHSQTALRFVLEGKGAHTAVNGEKTLMNFGDFIITPAKAWHDHSNFTKDPMFWLDGLDIPLVQFLDASFLEHYEDEEQPITKFEGESLARFGANLLPVDAPRTSPVSPIFNYPYCYAREALEKLKAAQDYDACHGLKMKYTNPLNGDYAMPTMGAFLQLLPKNFTTKPFRSTDATIFVCAEGSGESTINGQKLSWKAKDVFVVPSWMMVTHHAVEESILFSYSDRPVHEKLGLYREWRSA